VWTPCTKGAANILENSCSARQRHRVSLTEMTADIDAGDAVMKPNDEAVLSK
jgi:hypothetical protein